MALKQEPRLLQFTSPLGPDVLLLTRMMGHEEMSRLFEFRLDMISDQNTIKATDIVGSNVTMTVRLGDDSERHFNGFVSRFMAGDEDEQGRRNYRATVVPWLWFLTQTTDCRIFQEQSVPDIIMKIFEDLGFSSFVQADIRGNHAKREYCVQYRESDFAFVSRLMEEEGIFYFFKHDKGEHKLVMSDAKTAYLDAVEKKVTYVKKLGDYVHKGVLTEWEHQFEFRPGKVARTDYNFKTPTVKLMTQEQTVLPLSDMKKYELYDYPGEYRDVGEGQPLSRVRMEEQEAGYEVVHGAGTCKTFSPGYKFSIAEHKSNSEKNKSYVLTRIEHWAVEPLAYETGTPEEAGYRNTFRCIPDSILFRPERITPRPFVQGPQTAVVVGPSGETIYPDEFGRVKVQFFWDREGKKDDQSSCWCRVSQNWAGPGWGGMFIPHVGHEVIVQFLEGDPDHPIITGRVYNGQNDVPLPLPANKTQCIIRDHGDNQMIWEGKDGVQHIRIEQKCGNFIQMNGTPGEESIKLQDKFGSMIMLNSPDKTISLYSPNHKSGIVLGKSINSISDSAGIDWKGGHAFEGHGGSKVTGQLGLKGEVVVGAQLGVGVGEKVALFGGANYEVSWGTKFTWAKQSTYNLTAGDSVLDSEKRVIIDADNEVVLLGGKKDHGRIKADDEEVVIQYKNGGTPRSRASVPVPALIASGVAMLTQLGNAVIGHWQPVAASLQSTDIGKKIYAKTEAEMTVGTTAFTTLISLISSYATVRSLKASSDSRKKISTHDTCDGEVKLDSKGAYIAADELKQLIKLLSGKGIEVESCDGFFKVSTKGDISLESDANIIYKGTDVNFKKGTITHANFKVLQ